MPFFRFIRFPHFTEEITPIAKAHLLKRLDQKLKGFEASLMVYGMIDDENGQWINETLSSRECSERQYCLDTRIKVCNTAVDKGIFKMIPFCLGFNITGPTYSMFLADASGHGQIVYVDMILKDGRADPAREDSLALRAASFEGHGRIVDLLLRDGRSDPSALNSASLRLACYFGRETVVRLLLRDGRVDMNVGNTALRWASRNGHAEIVRLLLANEGLDPEVICRALKVAESFWNKSVARVLLKDERVSRRCKVSAKLLKWTCSGRICYSENEFSVF
ncbi:MAG: hypothetical protein SGCHY_000753 [Lobulomycetales sp.]